MRRSHGISAYITVSVQHAEGLGYRVQLSFVFFRIPDPVVMDGELPLTLWKTRGVIYLANSSVSLALLQLQSRSRRHY